MAEALLQPELKTEALPCPKCTASMVMVCITPHPVARQMERHTYLCAQCNQTKTYMLQVGSK